MLGVHALGPTTAPLTEIARDMAAVIQAWKVPGEDVYATPFGVFLSEKKLMERLRKADLERETRCIDASDYLIRCRDAEAVAYVLEYCECESIILFYSREEAEAVETVSHVCRWSGDYKALELPYVSRINVHGGIISYAASHSGMFVLGLPAFVVERCMCGLLGLRRA